MKSKEPRGRLQSPLLKCNISLRPTDRAYCPKVTTWQKICLQRDHPKTVQHCSFSRKRAARYYRAMKRPEGQDAR